MLYKYTNEYEILKVIGNLGYDKSLGLDDFMTKFVHTYWNTIKDEFLAIVEDSRKNGTVLKAFKSTFLSLIPK